MRLTSQIILDSHCIYLPSYKAIIFGDVHIGEEESLNKQGILIPRIYFKHLYQKTKNLLKKLNPEIIIINGDLKHEFGTISETEWRHTTRFLNLLNPRKIILIQGNHDKILGPIAEHRNIELKEHYIIGDLLIAHGNKIIDTDKIEKKHKKKIKTIIIGHEHPAISISSPNRSETFKCFLIGKFQKKQLIVMPSFNEIAEGTDILREQLLSPYLKQASNIKNFKVIVIGDKLYDFGKIKDIAYEFKK